MMADLVRNYIGLCKFSIDMEALTHQSIEAQIDIHFLVCRAIERPGRALSLTATGGDTTAEDIELRFDVSRILCRE